MLLTFETNAHNRITMFGDIGLQLIRLMGRSDRVPGALLAVDIPDALALLRAGLEKSEDPDTKKAEANSQDPDEEPPVSLKHRALPLIDLLESAARENDSVMWDRK